MQIRDKSRAKFSRREIGKLVRAVEAIEDDERLEAELRIADLNEEVRLLRAKVKAEATYAYHRGFAEGKNEWAELTERWRRSYEALRGIVAQCGPNGDFERLDQAMRAWIGEA